MLVFSAFVLFFSACAKKTEPASDPSLLDTFISTNASDMEYQIRFDFEPSCSDHSAKCFSEWQPAYNDPDTAESPEAQKGYTYSNQYGCELITALQDALRSAEVIELDDPTTEEGLLNYMARLPDNTIVYIYRNNTLKLLAGDERHVYTVSSEDYNRVIQKIAAYIPFGYLPDQYIYQYLDAGDHHLIHQMTMKQAMEYIRSDFTGVILFSRPSCPLCRKAVPVLCQVISELDQDLYYVNVESPCYDITCTVDLSDGSEYSAQVYDEIIHALEPALQKDADGNPEFMIPLVIAVKDGVIIDSHTSLIEGWSADDSGTQDEQYAEELNRIYQQLIGKIQ